MEAICKLLNYHASYASGDVPLQTLFDALRERLTAVRIGLLNRIRGANAAD